MLDPFQLVVNIYMYYEATKPQVDYAPSKKGIHSTVSGNFVGILNHTFVENGGRNVIQPILVTVPSYMLCWHYRGYMFL